MSSRIQPRILAIGEVLWDLLERGDQLGGASTNFSYFTSAMGAATTVVSRIGNDLLGDQTLERFNQFKLSTSGITCDPFHPTGTASVQLDQQGNAKFILHEPAAWDFIPCDEALLRSAATIDAIYFGTLAQRNTVSRESIHRFLSTSPSEALRILDINLRAPFYNDTLIAQSLALANVLKINQEELEIVCDLLNIRGTETDRLKVLRDRFKLRMLALTKGAEGSVLLADTQVSFRAALKIDQIKDTIGAGDSFAAAMVMGLLAKKDLESLHDDAVRLAAYVCSQNGATPPLPDWFH